MNIKKFIQKLKNKDHSCQNNVQPQKECENDVYQKYLDRFRGSFTDQGYNIYVKNKKVYIEGNRLNVVGNAVNTFWTADDVLCKGDYNFHSNQQYVMIDIGLNIGLTTLSMARDDNIVEIYGYEPFLPTFQQAQKNLEKNPHLSKKISIFNFGLGGRNEEIQMNYNAELPGAMSSVKNKFKTSEMIETIKIRNSSEVLKDILTNTKDSIFLKMDCEGAEDEILNNLNNGKLLNKIDLIIMEWHLKAPNELIKILKNNGFVVFNDVVLEDELGFIRAVNKKHK